MEQTATVSNAPSEHANDFNCFGVRILFPFKPYNVQRLIMMRVMRSLRNRTNCLVESPTGTGKTLSIMSGVLGWLDHSRSIGKPFVADTSSGAANEDASDELENNPAGDDATETDANNNTDQNIHSAANEFASSWPSSASSQCCSVPERKRHRLDQSGDGVVSGNRNEDHSDDFATNTDVNKYPRVYFVSRTHDQLTQVISEINRTHYNRDKKGIVLAGRNRLCVNERVSKLKVGQSECCQRLITNTTIRRNPSVQINLAPRPEETCSYYHDNRAVLRKFPVFSGHFTQRIPDIEDLRAFGSDQHCCPYYGVRLAQGKADITFCTYNHIVDCSIRKNMSLDIKDAIIVFDEAHNVEDACRESVSFCCNVEQLQGLKFVHRHINEQFHTMMVENEDLICPLSVESGSHECHSCQQIDAFRWFETLFTKLVTSITEAITPPTTNRTQSQRDKKYPQVKLFTHTEMVQLLSDLELDSDHYTKVKGYMDIVHGMVNGSTMNERTQRPAIRNAVHDEWSRFMHEQVRTRISFDQVTLMNQLLSCSALIHQNEGKFAKDFRMVLERFLDSRQPPKASTSTPDLHAYGVVAGKIISKFSILCMNPAVAFEPIKENAWSVIMASGTLSPMKNIISELGCTFENICEGSHVIPEDRLYPCLIERGPTKCLLDGSYKNLNNTNYHMELGRIVADVCGIVGNGVLCFVASYSRMELMKKVWDNNGFTAQIEATGKQIFVEASKMSLRDFETVLGQYRQKASESGALLIAVHRGKISEGINFSDSMARAIVSIGIPYPNLGDTRVGLKKEYNDCANRANRSFASGFDWYACQAFRPLSQALGRCIRHRNDWGAVILLESRLNRQNMKDKLPSWLRARLQEPNDYDAFKTQLGTFVARLSDSHGE